jgi:hypothetical protein
MATSPSASADRTRDRNADRTTADETANAPAQEWQMPDGDQEFVFESMQAAPEWVDRNWAGFNNGPALALPAGDLFGTGPYHTKTARVGDTVLFKAATPSKAAHFEVVEGEPVGENATKKPPQVTAAALEDMLKSGVLTPDELGPDAKAQVAARTPGLSKLIDENKNAPEPIPVEELVKVS